MAVFSIARAAYAIARHMGKRVVPPVLRRTSIASILTQAVKSGVALPSAKQLLPIFKRHKLGIKPTDFRQIVKSVREVGTLFGKFDVLDTLPVLRANMSTWSGRLSQLYLSKVVVLAKASSGKGDWQTQTLYYSHNRPLSPKTVRDRFMEEYKESFDADSIDWDTLSFEGTFKRRSDQ